MGKAHQNQKKTAQPKRETKALVTQKKLNSINSKQTPPIQRSTQIHVDLWNSAMGDRLQFQNRNPPAFSNQDSPIHSVRTLVHKQEEDP
jgi:hypothetical protein